jgi:hypothetical protein
MPILFASQEKLNLDEKKKSQGKFYTKWKNHSATKRDSLEIAPDAAPWTGRPGILLRGLPDSARQRDILDVAFATKRKQQPDATFEMLQASLWANPSQGIQRAPWAHQPPTLCTSAEVYTFAGDAVLSGNAHFLMNGWPQGFCPRDLFQEQELRNMAGEAVSLPCLSLVMFAFYCNPHAPWWDTKD